VAGQSQIGRLFRIELGAFRFRRRPRRGIGIRRKPNDIPSVFGRKDGAAQFADIIIDQFDEMMELSESRPLVMDAALHAHIVGQPRRCRGAWRTPLDQDAKRRELIFQLRVKASRWTIQSDALHTD